MSPTPSLDILQLYHDCGPGGAERVILDLTLWLRRQGHRVGVATCREGWLADRLRESRIETHVIPKRRLVDFRAAAEILRLARRRRVSVLHAHEFPMIAGIAPGARLLGFPLVATIHGRELIAARARRGLAMRIAARFCDTVVAVSQAVRHFLVHDVGVPSQKVDTIYNGIDVGRYSPNGTPDRMRGVLGISGTARVVGTIGSLYPVKGHTYLLRAMAQVVRRFPDTVCLSVGRGELLPALEREAGALDLGHQVKFLGFRTDIPDLLHLMEVFVLPSLSEGLPLSLLEAQAAGKPVVASRVGGNPEVVEEEKTGYLVPPAEPEILADRITRLLGDPSAAAAMGDRGRARVHELFSLDAMARRYLSLYLRCANGAPSGPAASGV